MLAHQRIVEISIILFSIAIYTLFLKLNIHHDGSAHDNHALLHASCIKKA